MCVHLVEGDNGRGKFANSTVTVNTLSTTLKQLLLCVLMIIDTAA